MSNYKLLDCGDKLKLEKFGDYILQRPCPQALWAKQDPSLWLTPDAEFVRTDKEKGEWTIHNKKLPKTWQIISTGGLKWELELNQFGNIGVFTEHWIYARDLPLFFENESKILNLFSYTGSNCLELVREGFEVTVVDASKSAVSSYIKNLEINNLSRDGQRLILEDANKFVAREIRRNSQYDGIIMDAPSFGRGTKGEVFNIEDDLLKLLLSCRELLTKRGKMVYTLHSPRFTPAILENLTKSLFPNKTVKVEEILNPCKSGITLPSGFLVKIS